VQAPKVNCNPQKLASIITYFQKSRTVHSIKDLEKQLPSVASINGMQVKGMSRAFSIEGVSADFALRLPPGSPGREQDQR
jgi:hypothetical protein